MKQRLIKVMAYLFMPLLFTILGYIVLYIAAVPLLTMVQAAASMVMSNDIPNFNQELKSIYDPLEKQDEEIRNQVIGDTEDEFGSLSWNAASNQVISIQDIQFPEHGTHFANISCERIELDASVYWGDTDEILKAGVGQYMGSFLPGFDRTILLSAHNTTYFKPLQLIEVGDCITYNTNYGKYDYRVTEVQVIHMNDAKEMQEELLSYEEEKLIMYTCYPFETLVGTKQDRLFVFADKISGPVVE
jgi:sortase A